MPTLKAALETLLDRNPAMLLTDGAETWAIPNLLDALRDAAAQDGDDSLTREAAIVEGPSGIATIQTVDSAGFVAAGEPLYREVRLDPNFPTRLRFARERAGLSQDELAKRIGLGGRQDIYQLETRDHPQMQDRIEALASVLGVKPGWLVGWED